MLEEINQGANFLRKLILREAEGRASALTLIRVSWGGKWVGTQHRSINPVLSTSPGLQFALIAADLWLLGELVCPSCATLAQTALGVFPLWRLFIAVQEISSHCSLYIRYLLLNFTVLPQWAFSFSLCWCHISLCLFSLSNVFSILTAAPLLSFSCRSGI